LVRDRGVFRNFSRGVKIFCIPYEKFRGGDIKNPSKLKKISQKGGLTPQTLFFLNNLLNK